MGFVHVYTGNGKGKTTAAFGLAFRAAGRDKRVCIIQFMKPDKGYGEQVSARKMGIELHAFGNNKFVNRNHPSEEDYKNAQSAMDMAREKIKSGEYDVIILDEINVALDFKLINLQDVLEIIDGLPDRTELVLTGRYAHDEIINRADLVTEMCEVKHYFKQGVVAREGIEY